MALVPNGFILLMRKFECPNATHSHFPLKLSVSTQSNCTHCTVDFQGKETTLKSHQLSYKSRVRKEYKYSEENRTNSKSLINKHWLLFTVKNIIEILDMTLGLCEINYNNQCMIQSHRVKRSLLKIIIYSKCNTFVHFMYVNITW